MLVMPVISFFSILMLMLCSCNEVGTMVPLSLVTIPSIFAVLSQNGIYGCIFSLTSALVDNQLFIIYTVSAFR